MQNLNIKVEGRKLIIEVDLDNRDGDFTGKGNQMLATSDNWMRIPGEPDLTMNLAIVRKRR